MAQTRAQTLQAAKTKRADAADADAQLMPRHATQRVLKDENAKCGRVTARCQPASADDVTQLCAWAEAQTY